MVLARVVIHVLARVLPHVLARVLLHVLARVIIHVHDYYSKTCLLETPLLAAGGCSTTRMDFNPAALPAIPISVLETQTSVAVRKMPK